MQSDLSIPDLCIVMLVEKRADNIINQFVLGVSHIHRKRGNKQYETDAKDFPENFKNTFILFLYLPFYYHASESSNSTSVGSSGSSPSTTFI